MYCQCDIIIGLYLEIRIPKLPFLRGPPAQSQYGCRGANFRSTRPAWRTVAVVRRTSSTADFLRIAGFLQRNFAADFRGGLSCGIAHAYCTYMITWLPMTAR